MLRLYTDFEMNKVTWMRARRAQFSAQPKRRLVFKRKSAKIIGADSALVKGGNGAVRATNVLPRARMVI